MTDWYTKKFKRLGDPDVNVFVSLDKKPMTKEIEFMVGDFVIKSDGDYVFTGMVVAAFRKMPREDDIVRWRYVVENEYGLLHIFSGKQLKLTARSHD